MIKGKELDDLLLDWHKESSEVELDVSSRKHCYIDEERFISIETIIAYCMGEVRVKIQRFVHTVGAMKIEELKIKGTEEMRTAISDLITCCNYIGSLDLSNFNYLVEEVRRLEIEKRSK